MTLVLPAAEEYTLQQIATSPDHGSIRGLFVACIVPRSIFLFRGKRKQRPKLSADGARRMAMFGVSPNFIYKWPLDRLLDQLLLIRGISADIAHYFLAIWPTATAGFLPIFFTGARADPQGPLESRTKQRPAQNSGHF